MDKKMKEVLDHAIYGTPELKPEEKALFLSNFAERIHIALTKSQVMKAGTYGEVIQLMKTKQNLKLFLNGNLSYSIYSNYIKEANQQSVPFTIVTPTSETPFGLVLADAATAISKTSFVIEDDWYKQDMKEL
ncbi:YueI family protein [Alkalihalophilus marmarensis]|uniref:YueI family protein n=1 Tax=Alkalihalophilus marmarensis TaxID=521377 RepID=UPI002E2208D6|nr:YueI family protein [Alkalihalophilus marmarensis]